MDEMKMNALWEIVQTRLVRRGRRREELQEDQGRSRPPAALSTRGFAIQQGIRSKRQRKS